MAFRAMPEDDDRHFAGPLWPDQAACELDAGSLEACLDHVKGDACAAHFREIDRVVLQSNATRLPSGRSVHPNVLVHHSPPSRVNLPEMPSLRRQRRDSPSKGLTSTSLPLASR
jgi:hypothetical protein